MAIDSGKIIKIASSLPVQSNERGIMAAFGVYAAMNYNEFYYRLVSRITHMLGELKAIEVEQNLYSAVLECGYHTIHGVRTSMHWREHILSMIRSPEDEVRALVAFINVFGIGHIEVEKLVPGQELITTVRNSYDADRYLEEYGPQYRGHCYLFTACTAAFMDLVYGPKYPNGIGAFQAEEAECRSMGHDICRFIATPAQQ